MGYGRERKGLQQEWQRQNAAPDCEGTVVAAVRMDADTAYEDIYNLLKKVIDDDDKESWNAILDKIDYIYENLDCLLEDLERETENQIAQTKVLLENSYSNMMSQIEGIQGYVCGMSTLQQEDGEMTEINTLLHVAQAEISSKVSERTAYEYIETTIDQKADTLSKTITMR